jgi:hypothetical protein
MDALAGDWDLLALATAATSVFSLWMCATGSTFHLTALLMAKMLAVTNALAMWSLYSQANAYDRLLGRARPPWVRTAVLRFALAALLLFFGVCETLAAAVLAYEVRCRASSISRAVPLIALKRAVCTRRRAVPSFYG